MIGWLRLSSSGCRRRSVIVIMFTLTSVPENDDHYVAIF